MTEHNTEKNAPRPIMRVTTSEAPGPSGAGDRGGVNRNPRLNPGIKLSRPLMPKERPMSENQPMSAEKDAGASVGFNAARPDFQRFLHRVTKRAHDDGAAEVRAQMEALAAEWESVARESKPHLGCLDMHRHLARELRAALDRAFPPGEDH